MFGEDEEKDKEEKPSFEFPDGGWECSKFQNYNFKGTHVLIFLPNK